MAGISRGSAGSGSGSRVDPDRSRSPARSGPPRPPLCMRQISDALEAVVVGCREFDWAVLRLVGRDEGEGGTPPGKGKGTEGPRRYPNILDGAHGGGVPVAASVETGTNTLESNLVRMTLARSKQVRKTCQGLVDDFDTQLNSIRDALDLHL